MVLEKIMHGLMRSSNSPHSLAVISGDQTLAGSTRLDEQCRLPSPPQAWPPQSIPR